MVFVHFCFISHETNFFSPVLLIKHKLPCIPLCRLEVGRELIVGDCRLHIQQEASLVLIGEGEAVAQQADVCDRVGGLSFVKYNFASYGIFVCPQADFKLQVIFGDGGLGFPHSGKILNCRQAYRQTRRWLSLRM